MLEEETKKKIGTFILEEVEDNEQGFGALSAVKWVLILYCIIYTLYKIPLEIFLFITN